MKVGPLQMHPGSWRLVTVSAAQEPGNARIHTLY